MLQTRLENVQEDDGVEQAELLVGGGDLGLGGLGGRGDAVEDSDGAEQEAELLAGLVGRCREG